MKSSSSILVTGGAGYIGSHTVVELANSGYDVVIVDNLSRSEAKMLDGIEKIIARKIQFYQLDCLNQPMLEKIFTENNISAVIHFAAFKSVGESVENPLMYYKNNVESLVTLLQVMKKWNTRDIIFSSSCTVYGQPSQIPVGESAPFKRAESPYGATKQICERILEDASTIGFRVISLRYFNPIGAHPSAMIGELPVGMPNNLVPYITQTAVGIRETLTIFGDDYNTPDGTCLRDFIHVVDLAMAHVSALQYLEKALDLSSFTAFNIGTGHGVSVLELVKTFIKTTKIQLSYHIGARRSGDVEKIFADASKANSILNWKTTYTLAESLLHAWQWEKKIRNVQ
jgi:UDP-glucose 4-epimerase